MTVEECGDEDRPGLTVGISEVKRIVTSPLGESENGCTIVVFGPTNVRYGNGRATREVRGKGICRQQKLLTISFLFMLSI